MNFHPFQGDDAFTVDVSNGFTTVEDLRVSVNIVPQLIPIHTFNFTVREGLSRAIDAEIVNISHPFYTSENIDFVVEEAPQHGEIAYLARKEVINFTWKEVCNDVTREAACSTENHSVFFPLVKTFSLLYSITTSQSSFS